MNAPVDRPKRGALRPLWTESAVQRARRRCRTLVATPFAALGGLAWGVFAAPAIGSGSPVLWGALGAFAFPFFMYLEQRLVPPLRALARRTGLGDGGLASVVWEAGVVGGLVYMTTSVLGAPTVPAAGTALGVGAFYALVMEYIVCGSAAADVAGLIQGVGTTMAPRVEGVSHAEALARRGEHAEAIRLYRDAIGRSPRDASLYVKLARTEVGAGDPEAAVRTLRLGRRRARLSEDREAFLVRQVHEICVTRLGDPSLAVEDLEALAERQPTTVHGAWARREIADIESGAYDDR